MLYILYTYILYMIFISIYKYVCISKYIHREKHIDKILENKWLYEWVSDWEVFFLYARGDGKMHIKNKWIRMWEEKDRLLRWYMT